MSDPKSAASPESSTPRYRYSTVPPRTLTLPAEVLLSGLPDHARTGRGADQSVKIACSDVLSTNVPRIRLSRLREWLPDSISDAPDLPEWVTLPVAKVALAYQPETRREEIAPPEGSTAETESTTPGPPKDLSSKESTSGSTSEAVRRPSGWKRILKPVLGPSAEELQARHRELRGGGSTAPPGQPTKSESTDPKKPESEVEGAAKPAVTQSAPSAPTSSVATEPRPVAETASAPPPATLIPARVPELPNLALFQELFHTDESLDLQGIADYAGRLPGLDGFAMSIGDDFRCSENLPGEGFNPREIRDRMLTVLESAPTDLGGRGSVHTATLTLYFERGPISILRNGSSSVVVAHAGQAFRPGIRQLLAKVLETLESSRARS
ncbi:MAG: hypothetical protein WA771_05470 [Chthoniobacterales bacterium]